MAAWDARCSTCGALGAAANTESWRYVEQQGGTWWYRCCQQCVQNCRVSLNLEEVLKHMDRLVDERLAFLAEARAAQDGGRDSQANHRRRLS